MNIIQKEHSQRRSFSQLDELKQIKSEPKSSEADIGCGVTLQSTDYQKNNKQMNNG